MKRLYKSLELLSAGFVVISVLTGCLPIRLYPMRDVLYTKYREGTVKRHIAKNGRYLQFVWLRTEDDIDVVSTSAETLGIPSVKSNERKSEENTLNSAEQNFTWFPVIYSEPMKRVLPSGYVFTKTLGFISTEPGPGRVPLYEWRRNLIKEPSSEKYVDYYYSVDEDPPVARYRYQKVGTVGYVYKDDFPGCNTLFIGYDKEDKNHVLTTDKRAIGRLSNPQRVGAIRSSASPGSLFEFNEYRNVDQDPSLTGNFYMTERLLPDGQREAFQSHQGVAGGGDNPLQKGGFALAIFSLEHKHNVSIHSLAVAKRLFEFIENSEELSVDILMGNLQGRGFLRRHRHQWWPHQSNDGSKWGASQDEILGVIFGLKFFIDATANASDADTQQYNQRALGLLRRLAEYLRDHYWVYVDTRVAQNDPGSWLFEDMVKTYGMGTLAWQFAYSSVFQQYLGDAYIGDFDAIKSKFLQNLDVIFGFGFTAFLEIVTEFTCFKDLQLYYGSELADPYAVYTAILKNMAPIQYLDINCQGSPFYEQAKAIKEEFKYFNHAQLLFSALLVFQMDDASVSKERKKKLAYNIIDYIQKMLWCSYGTNWFCCCYGPAENNVLFAIVGKAAYKNLTYAEASNIFKSPGMSQSIATAQARNFEKMVLDRIVDMTLGDVNNPWRYYRVNEWQPDLPLGYPKPVFPDPNKSCEKMVASDYPWLSDTIPQPYGIGRDLAWEYEDEHFQMWNETSNKTPDVAFQQIGPFYAELGMLNQDQDTDNWCADATAQKLREYARVGRRDIEHFPGPGFMIEAGGIDYLLMRMLSVELVLIPKPELVGGDKEHSMLPVTGATAW